MGTLGLAVYDLICCSMWESRYNHTDNFTDYSWKYSERLGLF